MSSAYNYVRSKKEEDDHSMEMFIREEVEHQERLEAAGYRSLTWRVLRASTQLQGESALTAPPFFPNAGREQSGSGGTSKDQLSSCGMAWMKRSRECERAIQTRKDWVVEPSATNEGGRHTKRV